MSFIRGLLLLNLLVCSMAVADITDYLLPNGEPIVGVYYYSWFSGEPYRHTGWTPEFQYDNRDNDAHIREVIKVMTDYGINQASYSYWDNEWYLRGLGRHLGHAEDLLGEGRACYFSPYLEPRTVEKAFATEDARAFNTEFIARFLSEHGRHPAFCSLGGVPFTNIYVTYDRPSETDEDFRAFLRDKYGTIENLRAAWTAQAGYEDQMLPAEDVPARFEDIRLGLARQGTVAHADRQDLRAARLEDGWHDVIGRVRDQTGLNSRYTGDVAETIVSPVRYMEALTGMSWYSFGYPLNNPTRRPKLISDVAKFTDTTFLYTIAPGYVDRQQRWEGARVERDPFLYPYAWVKAIQSLPEGIMILTHSEWFEGSIIDATKEYGLEEYETTELYSSVFRNAFASIQETKRDREPVAIVFNEWVPYYLHERAAHLRDVQGLIKLLEALNIPHDVIPESSLSAEELEGRRLVLAPNCGRSLAPGRNELLLEWAHNTPGALLVVDESPWWAAQLDIAAEESPRLLDRALADDGRGVVYYDGRLGGEFSDAFEDAISRGGMPVRECEVIGGFLRARLPDLLGEHESPAGNYEIAAGPVLHAQDTILLPAGNAIPWGYITNHRGVGGGLAGGHSAEETKPWERVPCSFSVPVAPDEPVAEVMAVDSDSGRFLDIPFRRDGDRVRFEHPVKFHAMFAIPRSPVKLTAPAMVISPGQTAQFDLSAVNVTDQAQEGVLRLQRTPGLSMAPVSFTVERGQPAGVTITLAAGPDYASGDRTIAFELEAGGRTVVLWRPLRCTLPASIGARTAILGGVAGTHGAREVTLVNVGEAPATDVRLGLLDGEAACPDIQPGDERTVEVSFTIPEPPRAAHVPDAEVSLVMGREKVAAGLTTRSEGDGTWQDVEVGGRPATMPAPDREDEPVRNMMIYLWVDEAVLPPGDYDLEAEVEYFDQGTGAFRIEYDSIYGDDIPNIYRDSRGVSLLDTRTWKTAVLELPGARLAGRQNFGADLRINGIVPVGRITVRGMRQANRRLHETMTVTYRQFGHELTQDLPVSIMSLAPEATQPREEGPPVWVLNPYGSAAPGYSNGGPSRYGEAPPAPELTVTDLLEQEGLLVVDNEHLSVVWDAARGGMVGLRSKVTGADYAAFPGPLVPLTLETHDGERRMAAADRLTDFSPETGRLEAVSAAMSDIGGGEIIVEDRWTIAGDAPRLTLERTVTPHGEVDVAELSAATVRFDPALFDELLPLGVGRMMDDGRKRGWLETWHSDGWYFAYSGARDSPGHAVAVVVQAQPRPGGRSGLTRFRYGFFPADGLAAPAAGTAPQDELQVRLRGEQRLAAPIRLTMHIHLLPGAPWTAARELALLHAGAETGDGGLVVSGDWSAVGGVQTIPPTPPAYMFPVRAPYYSASLEGERQ